MKITSLRRTQSPGTPRAYLSDNGASGQAFGAGVAQALSGLGEAGLSFALQANERNAKTERFKALRDLSDFQTRTAERITELKRSSPPDASGFADLADKEYKTLEQQFLNTVPPHLQDEIRFRTNQMRTGVVGDALDFQYTQQDEFFRQGLADEYTKAKVGVEADHNSIDQWSRHMAEALMKTDLSAIEKEELRKKMDGGLKAILYGKKVEEIERDNQTPAGGLVDKIIQVESGGRPNAKAKTSSAKGLGQFTIGTWNEFLAARHPDLIGSGQDFRSDPVLGKEAVEWYAQKNAAALQQAGLPTTDGNVYLAHFLGTGGAVEMLTASPMRTAASVNPAAAKANKSIFYNKDGSAKSVAEVVNWASRKMGGNTQTDLESLDKDPMFSNLSFEDRQAIQKDATTRVAQERKEQEAAEQDAYNARFNTLLVGLSDGNMGQSSINAARKTWLTDFDDMTKAQGVLDDKLKGLEGALSIQSKLSNPALGYNPATENEDFNAWVGKEGLSAVAAMDKDYITGTIIPAVTQLNDLPSDLVGQLEGMVRSNNQQKAMFGLDTLAQLQQVDPRAFDARVNERLAKDVDLWVARKDKVPADILMQTMNSGLTTAERQQTTQLREEATSILTARNNNVPRITELLNSVVEGFDQAYRSDPTLGHIPWAARGLEADFQTLFVDAYTKYGTEEEASAAAIKELQRQWDVTFVGGEQFLMKYPPQKVGYKPVNGDYTWIDAQVRTELALAPDQNFQLLSDDQTRKEFADWQSAGGQPPSYMIATKTDGVWDIVTLENGLPDRRNFTQPSPSEKVLPRVRTGPKQTIVEQTPEEQEAEFNRYKEIYKTRPRTGPKVN